MPVFNIVYFWLGAREQKEAKLLRKSMHAITEQMHSMMRRSEDAETANHNTIHGLSSLLSGLCKMDRTPFRLTLPGLVPVTRSELSSTMESELVVLELQDCSLGDKGALEVCDALNTFVTEEARRHKAVTNLRKKRNRVRMSETKTTKSSVGEVVEEEEKEEGGGGGEYLFLILDDIIIFFLPLTLIIDFYICYFWLF